MLSLRRLISIIIITIILSMIYLIYGLQENNLEKVVFENDIPHINSLKSGDLSLIKGNKLFYIIGQANNIYDNVVELFDNMKIEYKASKTINLEHLSNNSILIFTVDKISDCVDLQELDNFIKKGGKVILAAGLAEQNDDSYLQPVLGIIDKTIKINYNNFTIKENFLPFMEKDVTYSGHNASTWIKTRDDAKVYISEQESKVPIVYSNKYGEGEVLVINATFLEDKKSMGILCGAISELLDNFIYPVMGTKSLFLDNFPITNNNNNAKSMELYGRTIESLIKDKIWPSFQGMTVRNDLKITSSILVALSTESTFPNTGNNLFYTISKSSMQYGGEVIYAGNFFDDNSISINNEFCDKFKGIFNKYKINGFAVQFGIFNENIYRNLINEFENVTIFRGNYAGNPKDTYVCNIDKNDEFYSFPVVSDGEDLDNGAIWDISSIISSQGFLSHRFDINILMGLDDGSESWNEKAKKIAEFEDRIIKPLKWLESSTLSGTAKYIDSYTALKYKWEVLDDTINLVCDNFTEGQSFYFRSDKEIKKIDGAEYTKINDNYYIIRIKDSVVKISW